MNSGRKSSGGRYKRPKKRKLRDRKSQPRIVKLGNTKVKKVKTRGGSKKIVNLTNNVANITGKGQNKKSIIKNVLETPSNTFLARQNILVKGTIIETELGKAKITNRPSQEGNVQAVLIE